MIDGLYPIGSRRYGVNEDDSDYDYVLIVSRSSISDVLSEWKESNITEYKDTILGVYFRIRGHSTRCIADKLSIPPGSLYDILVIERPDNITTSDYILGNSHLYHMIYIDDIAHELQTRVKIIRKWAKDHHLYGGAFPDGTAYFIYTLNAMKKGYSLDRTIQGLYIRCLYQYEGYKYISFVAEKSLRYMRAVLQGSVRQGQYQYHLVSDRIDDALRLSRQFIDTTQHILYIENNNIIHASDEIHSELNDWCKWLSSVGINMIFILKG